MTKVKICGISRKEDVGMINRHKPDYAGFVFAEGSRRHVEHDLARELRSMMDLRIVTVGVFVDQSLCMISPMVDDHTIGMIQLHGKEDDVFIRGIRKETDVPIIKAFSVRTPKDVEDAESSEADFVMLDNQGGGTGRMFDISLAMEIRRPFFLAGGLDPMNVAGAIDSVAPYAVDVSSGVETDKRKDEMKIKKFIEAVREEDRKVMI